MSLWLYIKHVLNKSKGDGGGRTLVTQRGRRKQLTGSFKCKEGQRGRQERDRENDNSTKNV